MLNYVNTIFCAFNPVEKNLVIKLGQEEPADPNNQSAKAVNSEITSIVISKDLALKLAENITILCNEG